jgi:DNA-binding MarR family transcriptional regulator
VEEAPASFERLRVRRLVGAVEVAREFPFEGLTVGDGVGVPHRVLGKYLREREVAALEAFEGALALAVERVRAAVCAREGWVDGVRAGLVALLEFFDEEPLLARYLVVHSAQAGPEVLARRGEVLDWVAVLLDDECAPARLYPPPLTAHAVASGVLGVLHTQLSRPQQGGLVELAGSLMSFVALPFLGARAAHRELHQHPATASASMMGAGGDLLQDRGGRMNHHREIEVLKVLAGEPELNNREVALRAGVNDQGQISRLLARLARLGLVDSTRGPSGRAGVKAWRLTGAGEQLHAVITHEAAAAAAGVLFDLPEELAGRLDYRAVCVLRAVGEQPWLTSREVAVRAGVSDPARARKLLAHLEQLGLVASTRDAYGRGTPKVWRITDPGRELDTTITPGAPVEPPGEAVELMRASGGRLSEKALSVLTATAAEPGLSNSEIALRVGISDANSMSQLLARLARRRLIENTRNSGRQNAWRLTPAGAALENAIDEQTPAPTERSTALDLLKDRGARLNHRVVSVLQLIATTPGLSNLEISQRAGIESKAHTSRLLARLARYGLIENHMLESTPFQANAWTLTATGQRLNAAIQHIPRSSATAGPRPALAMRAGGRT